MLIYNHYDIVFVGWGASTCILIIEMDKQALLKGKNILIIDPPQIFLIQNLFKISYLFFTFLNVKYQEVLFTTVESLPQDSSGLQGYIRET